MKRISIILPLIAAVALPACLKDKPNTDFTGTQHTYIAEITTSSINSSPNAPSGGLAFINGATLNFATVSGLDTVSFTVNVASDFPPTKDVGITLAVDPAALATYNASGPATVFEAFPDSTFTFATKTGTVKAGSRLDTFYVVFDADKIDPTHSYMLPITITSATGGAIISGNLQTIFFHVIGNPIAGTYTWDFTRWNATDSTGANSGHSVSPTAFIANTPTEVAVQSGYFDKIHYEIDFTNTNGVLSNFQVSFNAADVKQTNTDGVTVDPSPTVIVADPVHGYYEFMYHASTSSGPRTVIDKYYK